MLGIKIRFKPEVLLLLLIYVYIGLGSILLPAIAAVAVHELGHFVVIKIFGANVEYARIGITGVEFAVSDREMSYKAESVTALAGPTASFLFAMLCSIAARLADNDFLYTLSGISMVLGIFNLIPAKCLDGGRAVFMLISHICGIYTAEKIMAVINTVVSVMLIAAGVMCMYFSSGNISLLICGAAVLLGGRGNRQFLC